jgi:hypothetical protein
VCPTLLLPGSPEASRRRFPAVDFASGLLFAWAEGPPHIDSMKALALALLVLCMACAVHQQDRSQTIPSSYDRMCPLCLGPTAELGYLVVWDGESEEVTGVLNMPVLYCPGCGLIFTQAGQILTAPEELHAILHSRCKDARSGRSLGGS